MSTRCQIGFYPSKGKTDLSKPEALIYRHSDGYPGKPDGSEYGVLPDIIPFLQWFAKGRGIGDVEYTSARLVQWLCNQYDKAVAKFTKDSSVDFNGDMSFTGTLGHGICSGFHGDIEYYYAIFPDRVEVYRVTEFDQAPDKWRLVDTVPITGKTPCTEAENIIGGKA